jgi:nitroimidazol reductase NimA-like FMN-containing flavoprotein (pyridoxamine 5'-phosphate oxidase superfamily)
MSSNLYAQFDGTPMDSDDVDDLLETQGYGVISLCAEGDPYSVPVSFGYDGESVYFAFLDVGSDSRKIDAIEEGATARVLVTDVRGRFDWQSVAITGPVRPIDPGGAEWEEFMDTLVANGWFMRSFPRSEAIDSVQGWELQPGEIRGLERKEETVE